jgi:opacity protein-like surface antigen
MAAAQDYPKAEVFTGYSYVRGDLDANLNGWNASVAGNANKWFGVVADFGGNYTDGFKLHSFLFGPKFTYRDNERVNPYVQTLFGAVRLSNGGSNTAFGWTVGGGFDVKVHKNVAIRVIEAEYFLLRDNGASAHNGRVSTGVVWRFGGK